jgi:hypothetical protein
LSSNVWIERSALSAATVGALAAIEPSAPTTMPRLAKNVFPAEFVADGPVNETWR